MSVGLNPGLVAQTVYGDGRGRAEVVTQSERVAYLVRGDEADELAHEFVVVVHLPGSFIECRGLDEVPVVEQ